MKLSHVYAIAGALAFANVAIAKDQSFISLHYINAEYEDVFDADGNGFGLSGSFSTGNGLLILGEYSSYTLEEELTGFNLEQDVDELRAGLGYAIKASPTATVNLALKYIDYDFDDAAGADGFGGFVGLAGSISPPIMVYADFGYLVLDSDGTDINATDITAGASFDMGGPGIFGEYRITSFDEDNYGDYDLSQIRLGARFTF